VSTIRTVRYAACVLILNKKKMRILT
jgi:hypothetical protein